ncbi:MAG: hypothetical protein OXG04_01830 [Acidobacteria bacterium]|nr:hypothetical protein [Acidobacteriota bacterium]
MPTYRLARSVAGRSPIGSESPRAGAYLAVVLFQLGMLPLL